MARIYGLLAGLAVCVPALVTMTYISDAAGLLVGLFLLTFVVITAVYAAADGIGTRLNTLLKSQAHTDVSLFDKIERIEKRMAALEKVSGSPSDQGTVDGDRQQIETLITLTEQILAGEGKDPALRKGGDASADRLSP